MPIRMKKKMASSQQPPSTKTFNGARAVAQIAVLSLLVSLIVIPVRIVLWPIAAGIGVVRRTLRRTGAQGSKEGE